VTLDEEAKVEAVIDPAVAGTIETTGSDGKEYTLEISPGAIWK